MRIGGEMWVPACVCKRLELASSALAPALQGFSFDHPVIAFNYPDECAEICNQLENLRSSDSPGCRGSTGGFGTMTWHPGL
ncbi:unnamed protein product [Caretta caretta]